MSDAPTTPLEAARLMWEVEGEIDATTNYLIELRRARPTLERTHRMTFAEPFLDLDGSIENRRQAATKTADAARFALDTNDQEIESCKERLRTLRGKSETLRSINSNLKEELRQLGSAA